MDPTVVRAAIVAAMEALAGPVWIAATVLALAGVGKLIDPAPTRGALAAMGLPWRGPVVPAMAVGEVAVGVAAVAVGGSLALGALALWYLGFCGFVAIALARRVPLASCGCLGREDTPPTPGHLVVNALLAVSALVAAFDPFGSVDQVLADQPAGGVALMAWVAAGVAVVYLILAVMPATVAARKA